MNLDFFMLIDNLFNFNQSETNVKGTPWDETFSMLSILKK